MAIPDSFLDEVRGRAGLADVIGRRVRLQRKGREHLGLCPFHKEKTPSFTVNEQKGFYHCFGCGAHGSVFDFVMETEGLTFPEAVEKLAGEAGLEVPRDSPEEQERRRRRQTLHDATEKAAVFFERRLRMPEGKGALDYLRSRRLDDAAISRFRLGFAPDARDALKAALARDGVPEDVMVAAGLVIRPDDETRRPYDRFRGRVMFPIADARGRVIAFGGRILGDQEAWKGAEGPTGTDPKAPKYLNSPETPLFKKGTVLYGLHIAAAAARKAGVLVAVEGYMDVIALNQAGLEHVVAPLGTALTEDQIRQLWRIVPEPVLCFDGDLAGANAAGRAAERALPALAPGLGLRFAMLPAGKDPDSLVMTGGADVLRAAIASALPLSEFLWAQETSGRDLRRPEERAAAHERLKSHARRIEDGTMRRMFIDAFGDRLWTRRPRRVAGAPATPALAARPDRRAVGTTERVMLAAVVNHPEIYDAVCDPLGRMTFDNVGLDALRQAVLSELASGPRGREELQGRLAELGHGQALAAVLAAETYTHAFFARPEASAAEADAGFREAARQVARRRLDDEIAAAATGPINAESFERLRAMKQESLKP